MPLTLAAERRPEVQMVLDPTLEPGSIADAVIASDMYAGQGARMVLRSLPNAETHTDAAGVQRALVLATAAVMADALPSIKSANQDDHTMQFDRETPAQRKTRILAMYSQALTDLSAASSSDSVRPVMFTSIAGRRA
jgi:hypothetical protein